MLEVKGPVYLRLYRKKPHKIYEDGCRFSLGRADLGRQRIQCICRLFRQDFTAWAISEAVSWKRSIR